jgi:hypothetical protein
MNSKVEKKSDHVLISDTTPALVWKPRKSQHGYKSRPISEFEAHDYDVRVCT